MRKWPWWALLVTGLTGGAVAMAALLEWTSVDHAAIWSADLAMQGWAGAVVGAGVSIGVALAVLRTTIRDERERSDRQMAHERKRFTEQLQHERELAVEDRRAAAWAALMHALVPVDRAREPSREVLTAVDDAMQAFWIWRMNLGLEHEEMAEAVWDALFSIQDATDPEAFDVTTIGNVVIALRAAGTIWHSTSGPETAKIRLAAVQAIRGDIPPRS